MTDKAQIKSWSVQDVVQTISPAMFGFAGLCFASGLLVVNLRLAKFGVFDSNFVRVEYVLTGALFLFLVAIAGFSFDHVLSNIRAALHRWKERHWATAIVQMSISVLAYFGTQTFAIGVLSDYRVGFLSWKALAIIAIALAAAVHLRAALDRSQKIYVCLARRDEDETRVELSRHLNELGSSLAFVLVFIAAYAQYAYPYLSQAYGGGWREKVILIPTEHGTNVIKRLGFQTNPEQNFVGPVEILAESDKELIVLPDKSADERYNAHAIRLSMDLFDGVINVDSSRSNPAKP